MIALLAQWGVRRSAFSPRSSLRYRHGSIERRRARGPATQLPHCTKRGEPVPRQRRFELCGIDAEETHESALGVHVMHHGRAATKNGEEKVVDLFLLGLDDVRAGGPLPLFVVQSEGPRERHRSLRLSNRRFSHLANVGISRAVCKQ